MVRVLSLGVCFVPPVGHRQRSVIMRMAGIEVIDSTLTKECIDLARTCLSPYLFNHVIRPRLMSTLVASSVEVKPDPEVLACATILHDLGLTQNYEANERFEVDGANAARVFLRGHGMKDRDLQLVWDSIALHTTPSIAILSHNSRIASRLETMGLGGSAESPPNDLIAWLRGYTGDPPPGKSHM
jgi:HD superfamily phosphodiesterase